jgi:predicted Zn-dependent peptidase
LSAAPGAGDAVDCLALVLELYGKLARGEVEDEAIERARAYVLNRYPFQVATAADMLLPALRYELLGASPSEIATFPERLQGVAREDVGPALRAHLDPGRCVAVLVATASELRESLAERFAPSLVDGDVEVVDFRDGVG